MEVNFARHCFVTEHVIAALKDNCVLCINGVKFKDILMYYILSEFVKHSNKSAIVLSPNCCSGEPVDLKHWVGLLSNLNFLEFDNSRKLLDSILLQEKTAIYSVPMESFLPTSQTDVLKNTISLLVIDLTFDHISESALIKVEPLFTICADCNIRIVLTLNIEEYLNSPVDIDGLLNMCSRILPVSIQVASDSIVTGQNGNLIEASIITFEGSIEQSDFVLYQIYQSLNCCEEVLSFHLKDRSLCEVVHVLLQRVKLLKWHLRLFGMFAFSQSLIKFVKLVESRFGEVGECELLILKFLRTKSLVLQALISPKLHAADENSRLLTQIEWLNHVKEILIDRTRKAAKRKLAFLVESDDAAEILFSTLQEIKISTNFEYLDKYVIILLSDTWTNDVLLNNDAVIVTTVYSAYLHRLKVDQCFSFVIPHDYRMLLNIKKILKWKNGMLWVLVAMDEDYSWEVKKIDDFQRTESVVLKRFPTYINPHDVGISSLLFENDLCSFQPHGNEFSILPESSIAVVNRYCDSLGCGMSRGTIDFDFSLCNNSQDISGSAGHVTEVIYTAQTKLHLPVKSMFRQAFQSPIVKLPKSKGIHTKLQLLSRVASCLEVCRLLHESNAFDEIFAPQTRAENVVDEGIDTDQIVTRNAVYRRKIPTLLKDSFPKSNSLVYIYVIKTKKINMECCECYQKYLGFCSTMPLPKLPSFLIYNRSERLVKAIEGIEECETLRKELFQPMYNFHAYLMKRILRFANFDYGDNSVGGGSDGVLWTVLVEDNGYYRIDYKFLERFRSFKAESDCYDASHDKDGLAYTSCVDFHDKVVMPIHRKIDDVYYYAKCVRKDILVDDKLSDKSPDVTFTDYYHSKYGISLTPGQFMVEVLPVQKYLNFLERRYQEDYDMQVSSKRTQKIFLPTELCSIHVIPAHLWMQIVTIPVILHRLSSILYATELEQLLMEELKLSGSEEGPCLDESLSRLIVNIHKDKDQLGLQRVEDVLDQVNECTGNIKFVFPDKNDPSYFVIEESIQVEVDAASCSSTKENSTEGVREAPVVEYELCSDVEYSCTEKEHYPDNRDTRSDKKNNMNVCERKNLLQIARLTEQNEGDKDKERKMPPLSLMLVAMTSPDARDFFNYERLEFLGDAFLAFSVAVELFLHHRTASERFLSRKKSSIVSNLDLLAKGRGRKLWNYVIAEKFDFRTNVLLIKLLNITPTGQAECEQNDSQSFREITEVNETCSFDVWRGEKLNRAIRSSSTAAKVVQQTNRDWFECVVRNKVIADCIEALIGLYYIHNGECVTLEVMSWLSIQVCCIRKEHHVQSATEERKLNSDDRSSPAVVSRSNLGNSSRHCGSVSTKHKPIVTSVKGLTKRKKLGKAITTGKANSECGVKRDGNLDDSNQIRVEYQIGPNYECPISSYMSEQVRNFEAILRYEFNDKTNLLEALLHPSYPSRCAPPVNSNERLEFLGDSIFYLLVSDCICRRYPNATNAELTSMRCIVVNTRTFAKVAYLNNFHKYLIVMSRSFSEHLFSWSRAIEKERMDGNLWPKWKMSNLSAFHEAPMSKFSIPKDLADVFESVAASIYVDSGQLDAVWRCFYLLLKDVINSLP